MKKLVSKHEKHCETQLAQNLGCNFVWENENRCADFTTRLARNINEVAKVDKTSMKKMVQK